MPRTMTLSQKSLANVCLFCGEGLKSPSMCTYCGFKFCNEHKSTEGHQCIKTRYSEYIRKSIGTHPNVARGKFIISCEMCGFKTKKGVPIEYAGEELIHHTQLVGCSEKVFLDEVVDLDGNTTIESVSGNENHNEPVQTNKTIPANNSQPNQVSVIDEIIKLSALKEKGMISEQEFLYIKNELIKKIK
ncbi:MAG TPA: hypothetical protein VD731_08350 [Nitrosopumilaceae archaeon]|nr:hypothetical protein [Nitrosopumilaceae archaeon]